MVRLRYVDEERASVLCISARVSCFVVLIQQVRKFSFTWEMATWLTLRYWYDAEWLLRIVNVLVNRLFMSLDHSLDNLEPSARNCPPWMLINSNPLFGSDAHRPPKSATSTATMDFVDADDILLSHRRNAEGRTAKDSR